MRYLINYLLYKHIKFDFKLTIFNYYSTVQMNGIFIHFFTIVKHLKGLIGSMEKSELWKIPFLLKNN